MPRLDSHRKVAAESQDVISLLPPFSFFDFAEGQFRSPPESLRRIFSLARSSEACTLVVEKIPPCGIIEEENEDIHSLFNSYVPEWLFRLSFWNIENIENFENENLVGYAILKNDKIGSPSDGWKVFEAVFQKYPHHHNCVPQPQTYTLSVGTKNFDIKGILYCQQNTFNKACAQVAIRSLLSRLLPETDASYRKINQIAYSVDPAHIPGNGLDVQQIRKIFDEYGIKYTDVDYSIDPGASADEQDKKKLLQVELPYQKYAYSGLESGGGALVGFRCTNSSGKEAKHIIPFYGHTFNKDTWAPDANFAYFRIGTKAGYVPSEIWVSSFIGHDDNFGPNYCIPRLYIQNEKVDYVLELFRPGISYSGVEAEALALNILYSLNVNLVKSKNKWILRLIEWCSQQRLVFRAIALSRDEYVTHLRSLCDWDGNNEREEICVFLEDEIPDFVWAVEISTPHLFPANKRKLGEIVFDGGGNTINPDGTFNDDLFVFARLPGVYMLGSDIDEQGKPEFKQVASNLESHTELIKL